MPGDTFQSADQSRSEETGAESSRVDRRRMLQMAGGASIAALSGCLGESDSDGEQTEDDGGSGTTAGDTTTSRPFEGETLRVATWSGAYGESFESTVVKRYEEETGANIELSLVWSEVLSKIRAAPEDDPPYDLTVADGFFYYTGHQEGLFQEVNYDNVPNIDTVYSYLREFWTTDYGVPTDGAPMAIINSTNVDATPTNWSEFSQAEKLGMEGGWWVYPAIIAALASDERDAAEELYNESSHDKVWQSLSEFDVEVWYDSGSQVWEQFRQGLVDHSQGYYGTALTKSKDEELEIEPVLPEVTSGFFDHYCPVRGTDKQEMGEHFLNFMLEADVQTEWTKSSNNLMANKDVEYGENVAEDYPSSNEDYKTFHFPDWPYLSDYASDFNERFSQIKSQ